MKLPYALIALVMMMIMIAAGVKAISTDQLMAVMPKLKRTKAEGYLPYLNRAMSDGSINTCCRMSAFLAQLAHESGDLAWWTEFSSGEQYEGRKDLGNIYPGDGPKYKGRGPIQICGRANYRAAGQAIGVDLENNPTRASDTDVGFKTAAWFWNSRSLNKYADCSQSGFDTITKKINGGYNGKEDRDKKFANAKSVLGC
ncbi:hypothetical protein C9374_001808 [Naegleria lovaniensis]|uniref:Glycoside hydrolase family 19 catalytic domain-containing protein n=1 Tax=Naegleria lovaniensis TaxID=51637 RepID=A0AA88KNE1_NAELO|nr:uncharacterized protein C9374_001808 [Naegleria lovaniensis]KAG2387476.1 hypothetical protein C9374_001808 [Naegleria lovaniensis]